MRDLLVAVHSPAIARFLMNDVRLNPEFSEAAPLHDVVDLHEFDLIARQRHTGDEFGDDGERVPYPKRHRHQADAHPEEPGDLLNQFSVGVDTRSAELEQTSLGGAFPRRKSRYGFRDIVNTCRLETRVAAPE